MVWRVGEEVLRDKETKGPCSNSVLLDSPNKITTEVLQRSSNCEVLCRWTLQLCPPRLVVGCGFQDWLWCVVADVVVVWEG